MRKRLAWIAAVLGLPAWLALPRAEAGDPPTVRVVLDGQEAVRPVLVVEGDGRTAAPGDLVRIGEFVLTRGTEPVLRLRREPGRLHLVGDDGRESVIAAVAATLRAGQDPDDSVQEGGITYAGRTPEKDTFSGLSDAQVAGLRGVRLVNPTEAMADRLGRADPVRCCFAVANGEDDPVPRLPRGARLVVMGVGLSDQGPLDLTPLASLSELRVLRLGWRFGERTDLSPLAGLTRLRVLDLGSREVRHPEALGSLRDLRVLDAGGCDDLTDIGFARNLKALERIDLSRTPVTDLSPLSGLPALREIDADATKVRTLPGGPLPALRTVRLLSAPVPPGALEAFRTANPACEVIVRRRDLLVAAIGGVDRVRVRSGGTCHRRDGERTLAEVTGPKDVAALLALAQFDDSKELGSCMCCGDPTFELYAGSTLVVSLGFHHGMTLRWPGGPWPGDAHLTEEAGDRLCAWLAERGVTGPAKEVAERRRREGAARHRDARQDALLPDGKAAALRATEDAAAGADLLVGWFPEAKVGVLLAFRLLGAARREDEDPVSEGAKDLLRRVDADVALPIARAALAEPEAALGVGLWLLPVLARAEGTDDALAALLAPAARRLLSDPDPDVRRYGVEWTARVGRPEAIDLVRPVLTGRVRVEGGGAGAAPAAEDPEVVAAAVFALLAAGDRESLPRMRELAAGWDPEQRAAFEKAAAQLAVPAAPR